MNIMQFVNKITKLTINAGGDPVDTIEDATRINQQGQIIFVVGFFLFQMIFWGVAMAEFIPEYEKKNIKPFIQDSCVFFFRKKIEPLTKVAENIEIFNKQRTV